MEMQESSKTSWKTSVYSLRLRKQCLRHSQAGDLTWLTAFTSCLFGIVLTGSRNKPGHYEEGATYPTFTNFQDNHSIGTSNNSTGEKTVSVDNLAANYYRITPESGLTESKTLTVKVSRGSDQVRGWVVVQRSGNQIETNELTFGADNKAEVKVSSFSASTVNEVVLIVSNGDEHFSRSIKYSASLEKGLDLMFVIDTTGSMFDDIAAVKAAATQIVNELDATGVDYRVAVVNYEDFPVSPFGKRSMWRCSLP